MNPNSPRWVTRRTFHKIAAASVATLAAPAFVRGRNLNDKLNLAIIGSGGRGSANLNGVSSENIVALCDVNSKAVDAAAAKYPGASKFADFRKVFDKPAAFDAVVVSTCEHTHALATLLALANDKHVYCEKPLTYNIWEARQIRLAAAKKKVATQMGVQNHANENYRRVVELIHGNVIGKVREAHVWVSRAWGLQDAEAAKKFENHKAFGDQMVGLTGRPKEVEKVPVGLDWELWLGPAPHRPFHSVYVPGPKWYRWWDFGSGTMSDLGSHWIDIPFAALKLRHPLTIEAKGPPPHAEIAPASMSATYEYGARGEMPPVRLTWYQGVEKPPQYLAKQIPQWGNGVLFVGSKGMLLSDYGKHVLLPETDFKDFKGPEPFLPRVASHHAEWIEACKTGSATGSNFDYAGALTEANHLGNVAYRVGKKLQWDPVKLKAKNAPEAARLIRKQYRNGWKL